MLTQRLNSRAARGILIWPDKSWIFTSDHTDDSRGDDYRPLSIPADWDDEQIERFISI